MSKQSNVKAQSDSSKPQEQNQNIKLFKQLTSKLQSAASKRTNLFKRVPENNVNITGFLYHYKKLGKENTRTKGCILRILVCRFRPDDYQTMPSYRGYYDSKMDAIRLICQTPTVRGVKREEAKKIPSDPKDYQYIDIRPFDCITVTDFSGAIDRNDVNSLVQLVDVLAKEYNVKSKVPLGSTTDSEKSNNNEDNQDEKDTEEKDESMIPFSLSVLNAPPKKGKSLSVGKVKVLHRFDNDEAYYNFSALPNSMMLFPHPDSINNRQNRDIYLSLDPMKDIEEPPEGPYVMFAVKNENLGKEHFVVPAENTVEKREMIKMVYQGHALQWQTNFEKDLKCIRLGITAYEDACMYWGILTPKFWKEFAPVILNLCRISGIFTAFADIGSKEHNLMELIKMKDDDEIADFENSQDENSSKSDQKKLPDKKKIDPIFDEDSDDNEAKNNNTTDADDDPQRDESKKNEANSVDNPNEENKDSMEDDIAYDYSYQLTARSLWIDIKHFMENYTFPVTKEWVFDRLKEGKIPYHDAEIVKRVEKTGPLGITCLNEALNPPAFYMEKVNKNEGTFRAIVNYHLVKEHLLLIKNLSPEMGSKILDGESEDLPFSIAISETTTYYVFYVSNSSMKVDKDSMEKSRKLFFEKMNFTLNTKIDNKNDNITDNKPEKNRSINDSKEQNHKKEKDNAKPAKQSNEEKKNLPNSVLSIKEEYQNESQKQKKAVSKYDSSSRNEKDNVKSSTQSSEEKKNTITSTSPSKQTTTKDSDSSLSNSVPSLLSIKEEFQSEPQKQKKAVSKYDSSSQLEDLLHETDYGDDSDTEKKSKGDVVSSESINGSQSDSKNNKRKNELDSDDRASKKSSPSPSDRSYAKTRPPSPRDTHYQRNSQGSSYQSSKSSNYHQNKKSDEDGSVSPDFMATRSNKPHGNSRYPKNNNYHNNQNGNYRNNYNRDYNTSRGNRQYKSESQSNYKGESQNNYKNDSQFNADDLFD